MYNYRFFNSPFCFQEFLATISSHLVFKIIFNTNQQKTVLNNAAKFSKTVQNAPEFKTKIHKCTHRLQYCSYTYKYIKFLLV